MRRLALIRARRGSQGLPDKNMRLIGGKPLVQWTIEAAVASGCFSAVAVSSNWREVLELAGKYEGVIGIPRPETLSDGYVPVEAVLDHAVGWLAGHRESETAPYDQFVLLNATNPFRTAKDISDTVAMMGRGVTNAVTVSEVHYKPLTNAQRGPRGLGGLWRMQESVDVRQRRKPIVVENGAVYAISGEFYREAHRWRGPRVRINLLPRPNCLDIDDAWDLLSAEAWLEEIKRRGGA